MNRTRVLLFVLLFVFLTSPINAQEYSDPLMQKLNDFLPTYTPFTPLESPDRYFPDDVGKKVADAIVHAYLQNPAGVEQRARELAEHDEKLVTSGEQPTGLTSYLTALMNQQPTGDEARDPDLATLSGSPDALLQRADQLLAEEKRDRVGRRFNWILSTFDIGSLLFGAPRAPTPYGAQGVVSEWGSGNEPAPRERKALVFYREFLRQFPDDPRAPEITQKARDLDARRTQAMLTAELNRAEHALQKNDYWGANFHYHLALMVDESSTKARAGLDQVAVRLQQKEELASSTPRDPLADMKAAQWEHSKQTFQYLLPGSGFIKDNFVVAGTEVATEGLVGAATFGTLTMIQTLAKVFRLATGNPVPRQQVITAGEKYVHNTPPDERNPEVYETLAKAYEREGRLDKALAYYKLAGEEDSHAYLKEQAGDAILKMAKQSDHQEQKENYLRMLVENYPATKAAREAAPLLRELQLPANRGLRLTKAFLREHEELIGPRGLGLKPELFDGNLDNVELADEGLTLIGSGEIALQLQSDTGPRAKIYAIPDERWERFWRRFREKGYEQAAHSGDQGLALLAQGAEAADQTLKGMREKNDEQGWRMLPYLSGSVGGSGVDFRGTLPKEIAGTRLAFGSDQRSSYVGMEIPVPFVPVDFLFLGRNGLPSLYPRIRLPEQDVKDEKLYQ
jgi:tetratricopeptide (TPR) repeat protein